MLVKEMQGWIFFSQKDANCLKLVKFVKNAKRYIFYYKSYKMTKYLRSIIN